MLFPSTLTSIMAAFLTRTKQLLCFVSLLSLAFILYTLKWERTKPDTALVCQHPTTNVVFLKTHKTASTSVMHLFLRYANQYQRLMIYPKNPLVGEVNKFHRNMVLGLKPGYNYSVYADHIIFDYEEMRAVMPDDTKYITILRDPVAQFQSIYNFVFLEVFNGINISAFANLNISDPQESKVIKKRIIGTFGINQMAFDLGMDPSLFDDDIAILIKLRELDRQFDLVMITELFDESVILMKEKLCWKDWDDVISFKANVIKADYKARLSSEQKENLRRINRADQLIYDHFYQKLLGQIDAFGKEKMEVEVGKLREATKKMYDLCVDEESTLNGNENIDEVIKLKLKKEAENNEVCADLTGSYFDLLASIFCKQKPFFSENELFLDLIEIVIFNRHNLYLVERVLLSFFKRHLNIVSQLRNHFAFLSG